MDIDIPAALLKLTPGAEWVLRGTSYEGIEWVNGHGHARPSLTEVNLSLIHISEPTRRS